MDKGYVYRGGDHDGAPMALKYKENVIVARYVAVGASGDGVIVGAGSVKICVTTIPCGPQPDALLAGWTPTALDGAMLGAMLDAATAQGRAQP